MNLSSVLLILLCDLERNLTIYWCSEMPTKDVRETRRESVPCENVTLEQDG